MDLVDGGPYNLSKVSFSERWRDKGELTRKEKKTVNLNNHLKDLAVKWETGMEYSEQIQGVIY